FPGFYRSFRFAVKGLIDLFLYT
ncbi:MAG: hypothetical protein QOD49_2847, partial [Actinomycetota bacterium]|nr:hypothetical protein [Actinomycetota bacterium]